MLILGESTETVGFKDSEGSNVHLYCCANAGAEVIDAWAILHEDSLREIGKFGATVTDERWDRSFVGLDYEQTTLDGLYSSKGNAKALDFKDGNSQYILYQGNIYPASSFADFELKDVNGNNVRYVKDEVSNMAIADYIKYTKSDNTVGKVTKDAYNYKLTKQQFKDLYDTDITNGEAGLYNLDMILGYIRQSALPTNNDGNWVKNIGGRDYVFSDWIVTLTKAEKQDVPTDPTDADLRIMAEDLSATEASDFDFNDIVFDVYFAKANETTTKIVVQAAGGTLPLRIKVSGGAINQNTKWQEVHALWSDIEGITTGTMINTDAEKKYGFPKGADDRGSRELTLEYAVTSNETAKDIIIEVLKTNSDGTQQWIGMNANQGEPAAKFAVPATVNWCKERVSIKSKYESFTEWATKNPNIKWWMSVDGGGVVIADGE